MTRDEALAYFTPHPLTKGPVMLDPEKMREAVAVLGEDTAVREALRWYVDNDDTVDGMPGNEFWLEGRDRARALLGYPPASDNLQVIAVLAARRQP